ncbi:MAG: SDR family NAD(P)-dependent oxidoreductase [Prevotella sp.]|nr:SDR family NAD(P)-dependent oxidoreductase [Prevotella sp.]
MKKAVVMGATSGIGKEVCRLLLMDGWTLGLAARSEERLALLCDDFGFAKDRIKTAVIDITSVDADRMMLQLADDIGGMDLYFHVSGIGKQNPTLDEQTEMNTICTNAEGFARMVGTAYRYFAEAGRKGKIAVISSIAGTRGIGVSPSYSATKAFGNNYIEALQQLAHINKLNIKFIDIRPGFVRTPLLDDGKHYPLMMEPEYVAKKIVRAIKRNRSVAVIDWRYQVLVSFWRLIPRFLYVRLKIKN